MSDPSEMPLQPIPRGWREKPWPDTLRWGTAKLDVGADILPIRETGVTSGTSPAFLSDAFALYVYLLDSTRASLLACGQRSQLFPRLDLSGHWWQVTGCHTGILDSANTSRHWALTARQALGIQTRMCLSPCWALKNSQSRGDEPPAGRRGSQPAWACGREGCEVGAEGGRGASRTAL